PRRLGSTLFPYTTLFRSLGEARSAKSKALFTRASSLENVMKRSLRDFSMSVIGLLIASAAASAQLSTARLNGRVTDQSDAVLPGDRKSTRLNSSHEWISY